MTKAEIKQIILEEIYSALKELKSPILTEMDVYSEDVDDMNDGMDPATKSAISKLEVDPATKLAVYALLMPPEKEKEPKEDVNEISLDDLKNDDDKKTGKSARQYSLNQDKIAYFNPDFFTTMSDKEQREAIAEFMLRAIRIASEISQGRGAPRKFFNKEELSALIRKLQSGSITSNDMVNIVDRFTKVQQANKLLQAWNLKGWITFEPKGKSVSPTIRPAPPNISLGDLDLDEQVKKYVYSYLKESSNIIGNKLKEIETTGKIAALEAKLAAIEEMVNASNERLTRIDEDEEFSEMMDTGKVNLIRKEVKLLEKTREKLRKEYDKTKDSKKKPTKAEPVMDEVEDVSLEESPETELNESIKRFKKLANIL